MKKLLLLVCVCACLPGFGQGGELLEFPPYLKRGVPGPAIGEVLSDTLWNKGDKPAKFYIQFKAKGAGTLLQNIFMNDEAHLQWLKAQSKSANADERRLQYVLAEAKLQKMLHVRGPLLTDPEHVSDTTAGYAALHSITGSALAIQY
ncbi:MAG TPA: hypothetical protein VK154_04875, partial [Chitinophagales bacterium]|nr:hypothetical protein [Chitinophagales bacterium]